MPASVVPYPIVAAAVSFNTNGANTLITGVANQTIFVYGIDIIGATATAITVSDGTTTFLGTSGTVTALQRDILPTGHPRWTCGQGNNFQITLGAGNSFAGTVYYALVTTTPKS